MNTQNCDGKCAPDECVCFPPEVPEWEREWKEMSERYDLGAKKTLMIGGFIKSVRNAALDTQKAIIRHEVNLALEEAAEATKGALLKRARTVDYADITEYDEATAQLTIEETEQLLKILSKLK